MDVYIVCVCVSVSASVPLVFLSVPVAVKSRRCLQWWVVDVSGG